MTLNLPPQSQPCFMETCEICHQPFDYQENPNWKTLSLNLSDHLASKLRWLATPHERCEQEIQNREKQEKQKKLREAKIQQTKRLLRDFGFPKLLESKTFQNFISTKNSEQAVKALKSWRFCPVGILLQGEPGRGKSHLMAAFVNLWAENGLTVAFQNVSDLMETLRQGFDDGSYQERIRILTSTEIQILVLDDLGAEQPKEWVKEKLYQIIDARLRKQMPLFVTTNCTKRELSDNLHPRLSSRLVEACKWVQVKGDDYRDEIARSRIQKESKEAKESRESKESKEMRESKEIKEFSQEFPQEFKIAAKDCKVHESEITELRKRDLVRKDCEDQIKKERAQQLLHKISDQDSKPSQQLPMPFPELDKEASLRKSLINPFFWQ